MNLTTLTVETTFHIIITASILTSSVKSVLFTGCHLAFRVETWYIGQSEPPFQLISLSADESQILL